MASRIHVPLVLTLALLAILVASLVVGGWSLRNVVVDSFRSAEGIRTARILAADVLRAQLDEETAIRGYAAIHQNVLLDRYYEGRAAFPGAVARLRKALEERRLRLALRALDDATYVNWRWNNHVAAPLRARQRGNSYLELHGKWLVDRFRIDIAQIDAALANEEALTDQRAEAATLLVGIFAAAAVLVVVLAALLFSLQQYRMAARLEQQRAESEEVRRRAAETRAALDAERRIADTLQEALSQRLLPTLPAVTFSATYLPATEEAKVGGDWYDAIALSQERILVAIGDVTGHGIDAAIAMNQGRQLLIASALLDAEPSRMLERVNSALVRQNAPLITAIAGVIDTRTCGFAYAVAGHPPPILREPERQARLLEFGSLPLGVAAETVYRTNTMRTVPGAMIVLYTDGVIEHSRDSEAGEAALLEAVESVARQEEDDPAKAIRDRIFSHREIADDVAILTIAFTDAAGGLAAGSAAVEKTFTVGGKTGRVLGLGPSALRRSA